MDREYLAFGEGCIMKLNFQAEKGVGVWHTLEGEIFKFGDKAGVGGVFIALF